VAKTIVKVYEVYHCTECNARLGYRTVFSDGSESFLCDCHVNCLGFMFGKPSYEKELPTTENVAGVPLD
jgi:hypothetical protein